MPIKSSDLANAVRDLLTLQATDPRMGAVIQNLSTGDAPGLTILMVEALNMIGVSVEDDLPKEQPSQDVFPESMTPQQRADLIAQMDAAGGPRIWAEKMIGAMGNVNRDPER